MIRISLLVRFFAVVPPVPWLMHLAFAASAAAAAMALGLQMADARDALAPIFLLQALAAASGFAVPARRGHYDLLLTRGPGRLAIGVAHFAASFLPGVVWWMVVAALEAVARQGVPQTSLASGTVAAFGMLSALTWSATVPLPRMTGGIIWLLLLAAPIDHDALPPLARAVVVPWTLVGTDVTADGLFPIIALVAVSCSVVSCALAWIVRGDISLQVAR